MFEIIDKCPVCWYCVYELRVRHYIIHIISSPTLHFAILLFFALRVCFSKFCTTQAPRLPARVYNVYDVANGHGRIQSHIFCASDTVRLYAGVAILYLCMYHVHTWRIQRMCDIVFHAVKWERSFTFRLIVSRLNF